MLDEVINQSGDNWFYPGGFPYFYSNNQQFGFGGFRRNDRPVPTELRNSDWYHRRGEMRDYDNAPENQFGDISTLKDYANDDDAVGSGKRIGGDTDTAPGADPTLLHALREYERFYNPHRPHQGITNARPLAPLPEPITDPGRLARLNVHRHDRLGGILHEYEQAA